MTSEKQLALVNRLYEKTREGQLKWSETPQRGVFATSFRGYSVQISQEESHDPEAWDYRFTIYNQNGDVVESVTDVSISDEIDEKERVKFFRRCRELYELARRGALGVDTALDSILKQLE